MGEGLRSRPAPPQRGEGEVEETPANPDPSQPPRSPQRCISWRAAAQRHGGNVATLAPLENIRGAKAFSSAGKVHLDGVDVLLTAGRPSTRGWRGGVRASRGWHGLRSGTGLAATCSVMYPSRLVPRSQAAPPSQNPAHRHLAPLQPHLAVVGEGEKGSSACRGGGQD